MIKKLMLGAALGALMVSGALAQSPPSSTPASPNPPPMASASGSGKADLVTTQKPDQWLASKFRGTDVLGADDQKIGSVSDILFDKSGSIHAYVVGVGGILGVGAKEVAISPKSFTSVPGQNGAADKLKVTMSKDELTTAQDFARYEPPRPATTPGTGSSGGMRPAPGAPPSGR